MGKMIITKLYVNEKMFLFRGLYDGKRFYQVSFDETEESDGLDVAGSCHELPKEKIGNIYVGRVRDVVKNINAAFVEYQKGRVGYLSLEENTHIEFLNKKNTDKICQGDLILVQIKKEAVKTKYPVLTTQISLTGSYVVLNAGKTGVGLSNKINDMEYRASIKEIISRIQKEYDSIKAGVVVRTNAYLVDNQTVINELKSLICKYVDIVKTAGTRTCYSIMYQEQESYLKMLKGIYNNEIDEIVTDEEKIYRCLSDEMAVNSEDMSQSKINLTLYEDALLPLHKLYGVEGVVKSMSDKKVWLKSGAYLIIEHTEAMTVIDVNTGKCQKGKNSDETMFQVNIEAAKEIAYQLRYRNISGIIIVDFINMESENKRQELLEKMRYYVSSDRVKTDVIDITKLELVEITRMKTEQPVYEQIFK